MTRYLKVRFLDGKWPLELVQLAPDQATHEVVEAMQRTYARLGHQTGVEYQVVEADNLVDALVKGGH